MQISEDKDIAAQSSGEGTLTASQRHVMLYLSPLMEANPIMIGKTLWSHGLTASRAFGQVGGTICGGLLRKELVYRLPELNAWRLTSKGRNMVAEWKQAEREQKRAAG